MGLMGSGIINIVLNDVIIALVGVFILNKILKKFKFMYAVISNADEFIKEIGDVVRKTTEAIQGDGEVDKQEFRAIMKEFREVIDLFKKKQKEVQDKTEKK